MEDTEGDREFRQDDDHQQNHGQDGDNEGYEPAPKKGDHFDGSKTQTSIRSGGSKQGSQIAYSEMTEKVAVKSTRKKVQFAFDFFGLILLLLTTKLILNLDRARHPTVEKQSPNASKRKGKS